MRHNYKGRKLGTDFSHTKAMKKSLVAALFTNDRIKTVEARAKEIRPDVDKIITWAKKGDLHSRRLAIAALGDKELVREVFEKVAQGQFADRQGGYTRIMKLGNRKGDNASMVIMELCTEPVQPKERLRSLQLRRKLPRRKKSLQRSLRLKRQPKRLLNSFSFIAFKGPVRRNGSFLFWCTNRLSVQFPISDVHAPCGFVVGAPPKRITLSFQLLGECLA